MLAAGLGGRIQADVASVPRMSIGALDLSDVEVWIEGDRGLSARQGFAGRIGSALLQRYHLLLDPGAGRAVFAPGVKSVLPPVRWTSGLVLAVEGAQLGVIYVMRGSPAALAGWKPGERICAVDGAAPTAALAKDAVSGAPGRVLRLGMCDGSARALTLRRFY